MSKQNMELYIPTRGRIGDYQTLMSLPPRWHKRTALVCPAAEVNAHKSHLQRLRLSVAHVIAEPESGSHIGHTRQFIMDQLGNSAYFFMLDDDLRFYVRKGPDTVALRYTTPVEAGKILDLMEHWLRLGWAQVGISNRPGNHTVKEPARMVTRLYTAHGYNREMLAQHPEIRFDRFPVQEDFDITLNILTHAMGNIAAYLFCHGQRSSNAAGGCSAYRNAKMMEINSKAMERAWPGIVTAVQKRTRWTEDMAEGRWDVRIQWRKAFEKGHSNAEQLCADFTKQITDPSSKIYKTTFPRRIVKQFGF